MNRLQIFLGIGHPINENQCSHSNFWKDYVQSFLTCETYAVFCNWFPMITITSIDFSIIPSNVYRDHLRQLQLRSLNSCRIYILSFLVFLGRFNDVVAYPCIYAYYTVSFWPAPYLIRDRTVPSIGILVLLPSVPT